MITKCVFRLDSVKLGRDPTARPEADVSSGWDPNARSEHDGARHGEKIFQQKNTFDPRCGQKIFHQKNTCGEDGNPWIPVFTGMTMH